MMKPGTRVRIATYTLAGTMWTETGTVLRWTKRQGPREGIMAAYEHVQYDDGTTSLLVPRESLMPANEASR